MCTLGTEEEAANSTWAVWSDGLKGKGSTAKCEKKASRQKKQYEQR